MMTKLNGWRQKLPAVLGFSTVEMMIVICIVGILAVISAPAMYRYITSNRLESDTDGMAADLHYARSIAISNGKILRFAATPAGYTVFNPVTNQVFRTKNFDHGLTLALTQNIDFYPWGMADATVFTISNSSGAHQINLLPTGIVEVQ